MDSPKSRLPLDNQQDPSQYPGDVLDISNSPDQRTQELWGKHLHQAPQVQPTHHPDFSDFGPPTSSDPNIQASWGNTLSTYNPYPDEDPEGVPEDEDEDEDDEGILTEGPSASEDPAMQEVWGDDLRTSQNDAMEPDDEDDESDDAEDSSSSPQEKNNMLDDVLDKMDNDVSGQLFKKANKYVVASVNDALAAIDAVPFFAWILEAIAVFISFVRVIMTILPVIAPDAVNGSQGKMKKYTAAYLKVLFPPYSLQGILDTVDAAVPIAVAVILTSAIVCVLGIMIFISQFVLNQGAL